MRLAIIIAAFLIAKAIPDNSLEGIDYIMVAVFSVLFALFDIKKSK